MTEKTSEDAANAGDRTANAPAPLEAMAAEIGTLANGLVSTLTGHLARLPEPGRLSRETSKHIAKRLPPKAAAQHANWEGAIRLLALEVEDLGQRISRYRYIERYLGYFSPPNAEMRAAFVNHIHVLRGSEVYVIMERCSDFLDFIYCLAVDLGLNPTRRSTAIENAFKTATASRTTPSRPGRAARPAAHAASDPVSPPAALTSSPARHPACNPAGRPSA